MSAFRAPAGKPSDVLRIISTHEGSFVFIKEELCDMRNVIRTAISHGHIK